MLRFFLLITIIVFSFPSLGNFIDCIVPVLDLDKIPENVSEVSVYSYENSIYLNMNTNKDRVKIVLEDIRWTLVLDSNSHRRRDWLFKLPYKEGEESPAFKIKMDRGEEGTTFFIDTKNFYDRSLFRQVPILKFKFKDRELKINLRVNTNGTLSKYFMLIENHFRFGEYSPNVFTCFVPSYRSSYIITFD